MSEEIKGIKLHDDMASKPLAVVSEQMWNCLFRIAKARQKDKYVNLSSKQITI